MVGIQTGWKTLRTRVGQRISWHSKVQQFCLILKFSSEETTCYWAPLTAEPLSFLLKNFEMFLNMNGSYLLCMWPSACIRWTWSHLRLHAPPPYSEASVQSDRTDHLIFWHGERLSCEPAWLQPSDFTATLSVKSSGKDLNHILFLHLTLLLPGFALNVYIKESRVG